MNPRAHPEQSITGWEALMDEEQRKMGINPKDIAGSKKTPFGMMPLGILAIVGKAFAAGARKYGVMNWREKGKAVQRVSYLEAAIRHIVADLEGETIDPESGDDRVPHIAAAIAGLMIVLDATACGNVVDNRPTKGMGAELMRLYGK
jgi:hypothetical protein